MHKELMNNKLLRNTKGVYHREWLVQQQDNSHTRKTCDAKDASSQFQPHMGLDNMPKLPITTFPLTHSS